MARGGGGTSLTCSDVPCTPLGQSWFDAALWKEAVPCANGLLLTNLPAFPAGCVPFSQGHLQGPRPQKQADLWPPWYLGFLNEVMKSKASIYTSH